MKSFLKWVFGYRTEKLLESPSPNPDKWLFNTRKHYKIWCSADPAECLDAENKLRLIKLCTKNPEIDLTLIYSAKCLNSSSQNAQQSLLPEEQMKINFGKRFMQDMPDCYNNTDDPLKIADERISKIKNNLIKISVVCFSGPDIIDALFENSYRKYFYLSSRKENVKDMYIKEKSELKENYSSHSKNNFDGSWAPLGAREKQTRSKMITDHVITIQHCFRRYRTRKKQALDEIRSINPCSTTLKL